MAGAKAHLLVCWLNDLKAVSTGSPLLRWIPELAQQTCSTAASCVEVMVCQVVVDAVDPRVLVSECATRSFDFATVREEELHDITIPLDFTIGVRPFPKLDHAAVLMNGPSLHLSRSRVTSLLCFPGI